MKRGCSNLNKRLKILVANISKVFITDFINDIAKKCSFLLEKEN